MDFYQSQYLENAGSPWSGLEDSSQHRTNQESVFSYKQPRVRWDLLLHQRFVNAIRVLGGVERAKPKAIVERMHVNGLTTDHVKSHLQKYKNDIRLGRAQPPPPPPTEAAPVRLGLGISANGGTLDVNRNNPTPPFYFGVGNSTPTGETTNINSIQSTYSLQVGAHTSSQYREATYTNGNTGNTPFFHPGAITSSWKGKASNMNMINVASSLHLRPSTSTLEEETSNMKKVSSESQMFCNEWNRQGHWGHWGDRA